MDTTNIKEQLHECIDKGDERLLRLIYALVKEYNDDNTQYQFSEEDINQFDERRQMRLSGESRTYTWEETKAIVTGKKSME